MKKLLTANDIMTSDIIAVDFQHTIKQANDKMAETKRQKLVVNEDGNPRYLLRARKIVNIESDKKISEIKNDLDKLIMVPPDTPVKQVATYLQNAPAILVKIDNPPRWGLITPDDIIRKVPEKVKQS